MYDTYWYYVYMAIDWLEGWLPLEIIGMEG